MFLEYIYIEKFEEIVEELELNFKQKYDYKYNKKKLYIKNNVDYIDNFYEEYPNIYELTGILGKNTSGKSSILRIINIIWNIVMGQNHYTKIKFIAIFRKEKEILIYDYLDKKISISKSSLKVCEDRIIHKRKETDDDVKTLLIYYSGIFDKSKTFSDGKFFEDISTNKMIRKSLEDTYKRRRGKWRLFEYEEDEEAFEQFGFISEFRREETFRIMKYYTEVINSKFREELLFDFPKKFYMSFSDNFKIKSEIRNLYENNDKEKIIDEFLELIEEYTLQFSGEVFEEFNDKENIVIQFALLIYFEMIRNIKEIYEIEFINRVKSLLNEIYKNIYDKEDDMYIVDIILKSMEGYYEYNDDEYIEGIEFEEIDNEELIEKDIKSGKFIEDNMDEDILGENILSENVGLSISDTINRYIEFLHCIEMMDYSGDIVNNYYIGEKYEEFSKLETVVDRVEFIIRNTEDIISLKNKIEFLNVGDNDDYSVIDNKKYSRDLLSENLWIDKKLEETLLRDEDGEYYQKYKELLYDYDYENSDLFYFYIESVIERVSIALITVQSQEKEEIDFDMAFNKNEVRIKKDRIDIDDEIYDYINKYVNIIRKFREMISESICNIEFNKELILEKEWNDRILLEFLELLNNLCIETFSINYECENLSSGQIIYFEIQQRLYDLKSRGVDSDNIILLIDEGDIYMHPGIQVKFIEHTLKFLNEFFDDKKIQIIITTNSPFIMSDIPSSKLIYIEKNNNIIKIDNSDDTYKLKTLGAPINELLLNGFFMDDGIIGKFAQSKINKIIEILYNDNAKQVLCEDKNHSIFKTIDSIGDYIIRKKLTDKYDSIVINKSDIIDRISYYEEQIRILKDRIED